MGDGSSRRKLAIHGPIVELDCAVPWLENSLNFLLDKFAVPGSPRGVVHTTGIIQPYDAFELAGRIPATARNLGRTPDGVDICQDGDRVWLTDDRWGLCEINFSRNQFRASLVAEPKLDPHRVAEQAVLWPLAQLLKTKGLHMLPAAAAVRNGVAFLMLSPVSLEPELRAMISQGYKIIGQRWTAFREDDGRVALLHIPGRLERSGPRPMRLSGEQADNWIDLTANQPGSSQNNAYCDAVVIVEAGRHAMAQFQAIPTNDAVGLLQSQWPILQLTPTGHANAAIEQLARHSRCYRLRLSRSPRETLGYLNSIRFAEPQYGQQSAAA